VRLRIAMRALSRRPGVLRLMQLFMEGQHSSMQRLMHEQAHCMQSYDLVSAVANVLDELQLRTQELIMDGAPHVLLLMIQAFHTLTECVQGPCPQNQQLLSASNLTKTINNMMRLLLPDRYEAVWSTAEMLPFNIYIRPLLFDDWGCTVPIPRLCSYLRTSILHTLKAVLEGGGRHIAVMVLQKLHLTNLQDQMLSIFNVLHERDAASRNLCAAMANASESDQLLDEGLWRAPCKGTWPASRGAEDIAGSAGEWVAPQPGHGMHEIDALEEHAQIGVKEVLHKEGYHYISLLKMLMLFDEAHFEVVSSMLKHMKSTVPTVHAFFENMVASVEVKHLDTVQKAFFPMPEQCSVVRQDGPWVREMEQRFVRMTHTSTQEKAHSFQQIAQIGAFQTAYLYSLLMEKRTRILLRHRSVIVNMPFWLSCLICTVLALFHDQEGSVGPDFKFKLDPDKIVIAMLGVLHVVATALALCKYVYVDAPGMLCEIKHRSLQNLQRETKFRRKANRKLTVEELQTTHQKAAGEASTWYTQFVELLAADSRFLVDLASLLASLLAFFTSPFLFVFHLTLFFQNPNGKNILRAVTNVGGKIASTLLLGILLVVIFAFISFLCFQTRLRNAYDDSGCTFEDVGDDEECTTEQVTLFQVVTTHLQSAFLGIGIFNLFDPKAASNSPSVWRVAVPSFFGDGEIQYQNLHVVLFAIIWQMVLVNIVTGLIIDSFLQIRLVEKECEEEAQQKCYVCSLERMEMELKHKLSFREHIRSVHNPWSYIAYLLYLANKDTEKLSAIETFVQQQLEEGLVEWIPILRVRELDVREDNRKLVQNSGDRSHHHSQSTSYDLSERITTQLTGEIKTMLAAQHKEHENMMDALSQRLKNLEEGMARIKNASPDSGE
ncbi:hypothetical protein CYMTET_34467, partial [Cymbomonas tetramitiformis]